MGSRAGNELFSAAISGPEAIAAVVRRSRGQRWTASQLAAALASVRFDWQNLYAAIDVDEQVIRLGMDLAETHGLRGADAIHLGAALTLQATRLAAGLTAITFVSADQEQLHATAAEGLLTEDPNQHR